MLLVGLAVFVSAWATTYGASVYKGWNLVYGFQSPEQIDTIDKSNIKAIYAFIPTTQSYLRAWPNPDEKAWQNLDKVMDDHELLQTAYWVYSYITVEGSLNGLSHFTEYWVYDAPVHYTERPIYKGWNFVGVTKDMIPGPLDTNLKDIKGNCNIEKSYFWNADMQKWEDASIENAQLEEGSLGSGWVIKVSGNCKLGTSNGGNIPSVPQLPNEQKECTDSDGGLNYIIKGTVTDGSETLEDFCVDSVKLSEALCNSDQRGAYAQYVCSDGCYEGACIVPSCLLNNPFNCNKGNVYTNSVDIVLQNLGSEALNIKNIEVKGCGSSSTVTFMNTNELKTLKIPCSTALVSGIRFIGDITVTYKKVNGNYDLISVGRIVNQIK